MNLETKHRGRGWLTREQFSPLRHAIREKAGRDKEPTWLDEPERAPAERAAAAEAIGQAKLDFGEEDARCTTSR